MNKKMVFLIAVAVISLTLNGNDSVHAHPSSYTEMDHSMHMHASEAPNNVKIAENPTFKVGTEAVIMADHMKGMEGAIATIAGAFDTTAYSVSYVPTTGGEKVKNHKWVIQEEIQNAGEKPFVPGAKVVLEADHMKGMKGATAKIDSVKHTTVYMIDFTPTTGGDRVINHKWVTEDELAPLS